MVKFNIKALHDYGLDFRSTEDAIIYLRSLVEYFKTCSRNLTEEQLRRVMLVMNILECMEVE